MGRFIMDYENILEAHRLTKTVPYLMGSSGYGKTTIYKKYAEKHGMELLIVSIATLDPFTIIIPKPDPETGIVKSYPFHWLARAMGATKDKPLLLLLDEFNRCRDQSVMNLMTELLLERKIDTHHISDHTFIAATGNLDTEDVGVIPINDAVQQRLTHLLNIPRLEEIITHLDDPLAKEVALQNSSLLALPSGDFPSEPKANARQFCTGAKIIRVAHEQGIKLGKQEKLAIMAGRIGLEKAEGFLVLAEDILNRKKDRERLPRKITRDVWDVYSKWEKSGKKLEVSVTLLEPHQDPKEVADFLLFCATPETCRQMYDNGFKYKYEEIPKITPRKQMKDENGVFNGKFIEDPDMVLLPDREWFYYAIQNQQLALGGSL